MLGLCPSSVSKKIYVILYDSADDKIISNTNECVWLRWCKSLFLLIILTYHNPTVFPEIFCNFFFHFFKNTPKKFEGDILQFSFRKIDHSLRILSNAMEILMFNSFKSCHAIQIQSKKPLIKQIRGANRWLVAENQGSIWSDEHFKNKLIV